MNKYIDTCTNEPRFLEVTYKDLKSRLDRLDALYMSEADIISLLESLEPKILHHCDKQELKHWSLRRDGMSTSFWLSRISRV